MNNDTAQAFPEKALAESIPSDVLESGLLEGTRSDEDSGTISPAGEEASVLDAPAIDWEKALGENESWLRTVIAARVGEKAAVEEVFQEVSLATIRQKAPIHDPTKISPWLYRLAVTQSLLYRRSMGRKRKLIDRYTEKVPIVEYDTKQEDPLSWLLRQERMACVRKCMAELPKNLQELLLLKYIHEWSYKEMAEKLGTTVSAIQARLHRARTLLREKLSKMSIDSP